MCQSSVLRITMPLVVAVILVVSGSRSVWALGNGIVDETNEYPNACAVLGLRYENDESPRIATGVLIHPRVVLTAGHVIDWFQTIWDTPPENVRICFDLDAYDPGAAWLKVADYRLHPLYNGGEGPNGFGDPHDLGLIILKEAVPGSDEDPAFGIDPAILPDEGLLDLFKETGLLQFGLEAGTPLPVVGYGRGLSFPPPEDVRDDRGVRRYGIFRCMGLTQAHLHFFSDPFGVSLQRGDSGGPTLLETEDGYVVLAVFSWTGVGQYVGIDHHYRVDTADALDFIYDVLMEVE